MGGTLVENYVSALVDRAESPFHYLDLGLYMHFFVSALMPKGKRQSLHDQFAEWN